MEKSNWLNSFFVIIIITILFYYPSTALAYRTLSYDVKHVFKIQLTKGVGKSTLMGSASDLTEVHDPGHRYDIKSGSFVIDQIGTNKSFTAEVLPSYPPFDPEPWGYSTARATSQILVNPFSSSAKYLDGNIHVYGFAELDSSSHYAGSEALAAVWLQGPTPYRLGTMYWTPTILAEVVSGSAILDDPICFSVRDLETNTILQGTLLDISAQLSGQSAMEWFSENYSLAVKTPAAPGNNLSFKIALTSKFSKEYGSLALEIRDGIITQAEDEGIFDGVLPKIGQEGVFTCNLGPIQFDYDLGNFSGHDLEVAFDFSGGGRGLSGVAVPLPSSFLLLLWGLGSLKGHLLLRRRRR